MTAPHQREAHAGVDLRLLRAAVFAVLCVVLSAGGHVLASCAAVPLWTLGVGFAAVLAVAAPLAGRERSLPGIAAALAAGQVGLHALFGVGQHGTTAVAGSDTSVVERAARLMCGVGAANLSPAQAHRILTTAGVEPGGGAAGHAMHHSAPATAADNAMGSMSLLPSLPMLLGHVLAAVAAGWLLRHGDIALLRLVRLSAHGAYGIAEAALVRSLRGALALVGALRAGLPGAPEMAARTPRTAFSGPPQPRARALQHTVIRRGPPAAAALALAA
ncbi:hypothetical protein GCM10010277_43210 [Streptomyces longisporoflavus]|uniref:hypothetical protein n=1 Tax=Streptomyces longisporoflavus TaxID=28044 RepID=UPI00167EBFA0|nr:hypothetical protein [Streptomyces longisporoflavus]GGV49397.1 hypothetical protein GCM10010277_43210 [Streptomyces longisporoflavus]